MINLLSKIILFCNVDKIINFLSVDMLKDINEIV